MSCCNRARQREWQNSVEPRIRPAHKQSLDRVQRGDHESGNERHWEVQQFSLIRGFVLHSFSYLWSTATWSQTIPLLTHGQKFSVSLMPCQGTYLMHLTLAHHVGMLSSQEEGWLGTIRHSEREKERDYVPITFIIVYCHDCSFIISFTVPIYKLNFTIG